MPRLDQARLRSCLRLIFDDAQADTLVSRLPAGAALGELDVSDSAMRGLVRSAVVQHTLSHWLHRLSRSQTGAATPPLAASTGIAAKPALTLALHLGLELDGNQLAEIFEVPVDEIGQFLFEARAQLAPEIRHAGQGLETTIGRDRDRSLPVTERATLIRRSQQGPGTLAALNRVRNIDDELLSRIETVAATVAGQAVMPRRRFLRVPAPALFASALGVVALLLTLAGITASRSLGADEPPVPLFAETVHTQPSTTSGWLLRARAHSGLEIRHLATGRSGIVGADAGNWASALLAPNRERIALWKPSSPSSSNGVLQIRGVDGRFLREWKIDNETAFRSPIGWLGNSEFLFLETPGFLIGSTQRQVQALQITSSKLVAMDVELGISRLIFEGSVSHATPSPDGTMVAITRIWGHNVPGDSIELRPVQDGRLAEPIMTIDHRAYRESPLVWSSDSQHLFLAVITEETFTPPRLEQSLTTVDLVSWSRHGQERHLVRSSQGERVRVLAASPDGQHLIFTKGIPAQSPGFLSWEYWRIGSDGDRPTPLSITSDHSSGERDAALWSPDTAQLIVADTVPFHLPTEGGSPLQSSLLHLLDSDGNSIDTLAQFVGQGQLIAWLPESAIDIDQLWPDPSPLVGDFGRPEPVEGTPSLVGMSSTSTLSPDRIFMLSNPAILSIRNLEEGTETQFSRENSHQFRQIDRQATLNDPFWVFDSSAVIAVIDQSASGEPGSRLLLQSSAQSTDDQHPDTHWFDPAGIGSDRNRVYAKPTVSPTGEHATFFVFNNKEQSVMLWHASHESEPRPVASWSIPAATPLESYFTSSWINDDTLVVAVPDAWDDGNAREAALHRIVFLAERTSHWEEILRIHARGSDLSIAVREFALSPDRETLAYRVRHQTASGQRDTIHLARADDVQNPYELIRGNPGDGMDWSSDSRWLIAGLREQILALSDDGRTAEILTPDGVSAQYPTWVEPNEIWFASGGDVGPRIMRILAP